MARRRRPRVPAGGGNSKLTPALTRQLFDLLSMGNYVSVVCRHVGIKADTFWTWMRKGDEQKAGVYFEFREKMLTAEAAGEINAVAAVWRGFERDPKLALEFLARKYPARWGKTERVDVSLTAKTEAATPVNETLDMAPDQVELFARQMAQLESRKALEEK